MDDRNVRIDFMNDYCARLEARDAMDRIGPDSIGSKDRSSVYGTAFGFFLARNQLDSTRDLFISS